MEPKNKRPSGAPESLPDSEQETCAPLNAVPPSPAMPAGPDVSPTGEGDFTAAETTPVGDVVSMAIDRLVEDPNRRKSGGDVSDLVQSMGTLWQIHPVVVVKRGDFYQVVSGHRRLKAARELGWTEIRVTIAPVENDADLVTLDENLARFPLTDTEEAEASAQQKMLYEQRHPEARRGGHRPRLHDANSPAAKSFCEVQALATNKSPATVSRNARIGASATDEVKRAWTDHLINKVDAAKLAGLSAQEQEAGLAKLLEARARKGQGERPTELPPSEVRAEQESSTRASDGVSMPAAMEPDDSLAERQVAITAAVKEWHEAVVAGSGNETSIAWVNGVVDILNADRLTLRCRFRLGQQPAVAA